MSEPARRPSPHAPKFLATSAALIGFALGALALAGILLVTGTRSTARPAWSAWSPPDGGLAGEREIAAAVSPLYRAAPALQLVVVTVHNLATAASAATAAAGTQVAVRDATSGSVQTLSGNTAVFNLCGLGPACAITGTPSSARQLLLRREALELALYTFRYIDRVDNVLAVLPPGRATVTASLTPTPPARSPAPAPTATVDLAVLFTRNSLTRFLDEPLRATLPEPLPPTVAGIAQAPEAELVSVITGQTLFKQSTVQSQDGSSVLLLDPLPPQ